MTRTLFRLFLLIGMAMTSLKVLAWPEGVKPSKSYLHESVQPLLVTAGYMEYETDNILIPKMDALQGADLSGHSPLNSQQTADFADLKIAFAKLGKVTAAFHYFENFYYRSYSTYKGKDRLSPLEMVRIIDHLVLLDKYFKKLQSRKFINKILNPVQIDALEILSLKNTMLIQRLSLDINNVYRANQNKAEEIRALFNGVDLKNVSQPEYAIDKINHLIPRIARLESDKFKICLALF